MSAGGTTFVAEKPTCCDSFVTADLVWRRRAASTNSIYVMYAVERSPFDEIASSNPDFTRSLVPP